MEKPPEKPLDLGQYRRMLWRRRGVIVVCTLGVLCATAIGLSFTPAQYESEVTLLIEDRQPLAAELEQLMGGLRSPSGGFRAEEQRLSQMIGRIRSRPFLERVVKILKMDEDPAIREQARKRRIDRPELTEEDLVLRMLSQRLGNRIQFAAVGPGLYKIVVTDYSPDNAQLLAKWVSELFVDVTIQKELEHIRSAREFGAEQLRVYEEQLTRSEDALERYQGSVIVQNLSGNVVTTEKLSAAEALHRRMSDEGTTAAARVGPLARAAESAGALPGDTRLREDPEAKRRAQRIALSLVNSAQDLLASAEIDLGQWPPKGQVDVLRRDLFQVVESLARTLYPEASPDDIRTIAGHAFAELDAGAHKDAAAVIRSNIDTFKARAQTGPAGEMERARLEEDVRKNRELLQSFRAQMVASDVSQAVETTNLGLRIEIMDPAQLPLAPSRPNRRRILLAALLIGPMVGAGLGFLGELLDPTVRTLDDIRRVAPEPVLGVLPRLSGTRAQRAGWRRYWVPAAMGGLVLLTAVFFVARSTILREVAVVGEPVRMVDPASGVTP